MGEILEFHYGKKQCIALLKALLKYRASDLHLKVGRPPLFRIQGKLVSAKANRLEEKDVCALIQSFLPQKIWKAFEEKKEIDFSFEEKPFGRFRAHVFFQKKTPAVVIRLIPSRVPLFEELGLSSQLLSLLNPLRGLFLITGPTGSGKSTTLASCIEHLNQTQPIHIVTLEDPIEFWFTDKKASICQREIGKDTFSFFTGLRAALREDPDCLMIGELRDRKVVELALQAAQTGHFVLATLHTGSASEAIKRLVNLFAFDVQQEAQYQIASVLKGVLSQRLIVKKEGKGRIPVVEVLVKTPYVEKLILEGKWAELSDAMASSDGYDLMQTFEQHLLQLLQKDKILLKDAMQMTPDPDALKRALVGIGAKEGYGFSKK